MLKKSWILTMCFCGPVFAGENQPAPPLKSPSDLVAYIHSNRDCPALQKPDDVLLCDAIQNKRYASCLDIINDDLRYYCKAISGNKNFMCVGIFDDQLKNKCRSRSQQE
jgi:hypothetical protein